MRAAQLLGVGRRKTLVGILAATRCRMHAQPVRKRLLIVYHSSTGGTLQMVEAAARGAREESNIAVDLKHASLCGIEDVLAADGYLFASPENLAAMSGMLKDFFDRTYYQGLGHLNGRPYSILICAGSDGQNAARQIARCATGWRLRAVTEPIIILTRAQTPEKILAPKTIPDEHLQQCHAVGATLASGLELGIF